MTACLLFTDDSDEMMKKKKSFIYLISQKDVKCSSSSSSTNTIYDQRNFSMKFHVKTFLHSRLSLSEMKFLLPWTSQIKWNGLRRKVNGTSFCDFKNIYLKTKEIWIVKYLRLSLKYSRDFLLSTWTCWRQVNFSINCSMQITPARKRASGKNLSELMKMNLRISEAC